MRVKSSLLIFGALVVSVLSLAERVPAADEAERAKLQRFRDALALLDSSDKTQDQIRAMSILRDGFPAARPVLVEGVQGESVKVKCFAIQVLGESGKAEDDLAVVTKALADTKPRVRLAAIMAIRRLGKEGYNALAEHLPRESDQNNRKMTIKTFQIWRSTDAVPLLVQSLSTEKEKGVQNFLVVALESLTERKLGSDPKAWVSYLEAIRLEQQAKALREIQVKAESKKEKP